MGKTHYIIPIFIPHKGCPFDCVFCNQRKITGLENEPSGKLIGQQIREVYKTIPDSETNQVEIAFFGGSFTGIDIKKQEEFLLEAYRWKSKGLVKDIRISTRPDYINSRIMEVLLKYGVTIVELGVQSMDKGVLDRSGRGHTEEDVIKASKIIKKYDLKMGLQMMLGLPSDSKEKALITTEKLIECEPDFVRIYPTLVIKDTNLEEQYLKGEYKPLSLEDAIDITKAVLVQFAQHRIPVIRVGLQTTEELVSKGAVVAGPFHPAFRQLVESEIMKDFLEFVFVKNNLRNRKEIITLQANSLLISTIVGHKRSNIKFFKTNLNIKRIKILQNNSIQNNRVKINYDNKEQYFDLNDYIDNAI